MASLGWERFLPLCLSGGTAVVAVVASGSRGPESFLVAFSCGVVELIMSSSAAVVSSKCVVTLSVYTTMPFRAQ